MDAIQNEQESLRPRFVLLTPPIENAGEFAPVLAQACAAADVAAVILRLAPSSDAETLARIRLLAPGVHKVGAALVLDNLLHLTDAANADGVHMAGSTAVGTARAAMKSDRIVGGGTLSSRHEAMLAGESGADYVLFGEPDGRGKRPSIDSLTERVAWWSELFIVPCIAYAARTDEIAPLVRAGADFIAIGDEIAWNATGDVAAALAAAGSKLEAAELVS
jgi:thiamine-phosphate pyrophosphorylase